MKLNERVKNALISVSTIATDYIVNTNCQGEYKSFVNGYAHDIILPVSLFFIYKTIGGIWNVNKYATAAFIFTGCSAVEFAQKIGWYHGTYDPKDFLAYAAGTAIALGIDSLVSKKNKSIDNLF